MVIEYSGECKHWNGFICSDNSGIYTCRMCGAIRDKYMKKIRWWKNGFWVRK